MNNNNFILSTISIPELESTIAKVLTEILDQQGRKTTAAADEYITRTETADILKISLVTLHHWTRQGLIQHYKISSRVRYKRAEVVQLLENGSLTKYGRHTK
jgi:excisionase family DNA binding protein